MKLFETTPAESVMLTHIAQPERFRPRISEEQAADFERRGYVTRTPSGLKITELGLKQQRRILRAAR